MPFGKFSVYTFLGVIPWTYALTYVGVLVQDNWHKVLDYFDIPTLLIGTVLVAAGLGWYVRRRKDRQRRPPQGRV